MTIYIRSGKAWESRGRDVIGGILLKSCPEGILGRLIGTRGTFSARWNLIVAVYWTIKTTYLSLTKNGKTVR